MGYKKRERNENSVGVRWKGRGIGRRREKNRGNHQEVGNMAAQGTQIGALSRWDCRTMVKNNTIALHFAPSMRLCS